MLIDKVKMDKSASVGIGDGRFGGNLYHSQSHSQSQYQSFSSSSSQRPVSYGCGSCGYELNLNSSNRITSTIGSKYGKAIRRGVISFFNIDESRFTQVDEFQCIPHFSRNSWGLFRRRTKLLCRKCNNHIGNASEEKTSAYALVTDGSDSSPRNGVSGLKKYDIRIRALQPSSVAHGSGTSLFT